MKNNPVVSILVVLAALIGGGYLLVQMAGACIMLLGIGLGASPGVAVVAGFLIAVGLAIHAIVKSN
jgi:hypothetical protein